MINAIEVDNVSKTYGDRSVLHDISFSVTKGDIHGFLGPNGAGKTTTMKLITKLLSQDCGQIKIFGESNRKLDQLFHQKVGFLLEDPPLYKDLTIREYLKFIAEIKKVPTSEIQNNIEYCLDVLDLKSSQNRAIENLSKGYKQRVGIAQAIINKPEIVILDEPTSGLDPQSVVEMRKLILTLKKDHTILLSSHLLHEMGLVCDKVTIISEGRILASGKINELKERMSQTQEITIELLEPCPAFLQYLEKNELVHKFQVVMIKNLPVITVYPSQVDEIRHILLQEAVNRSAKIIKIDKKEHTLEDIFIKITGKHD